MKLIATIFLAVLIISGCGSKKSNIPISTVDMEYALDSASTIATEHLSFTLGADLLQKREDIFRMETIGTKKWNYNDAKIVQYHYIGVYLGNGLFMDSNKNLGVDIINYFGIDIKKSDLKFTYSRNKEGGYTTLRHEDGKIKVQYSLAEEPFLVMEFIDNMLLYSFNNWMQKNDKIYFEAESIYSDGMFDEEIEKESETLYVVPHLFGDFDFEMIGPDTLDLEEVLVIRLEDEIQVCDDDPDVLEDGSYEAFMHLVCKEDGFIAYNQFDQGFAARRKADTIFVYENKELSYKIEIQ